jgi:dihydroxyacetone kinase-like predicted kinase
LGVRVIAGGQTQNPSVQDILDAIKSLPNPEVLVLPDNKNVHMAAQRAAELAAEAGKRVFVLPTRTVGQGLAAAVVFSPETPIEEQLPGLEEAAFATHTIEITHSTRNAFVEQVGDVAKGQALALLDDKIVAAGESPEAVLLEQLEAHLNGAEILTLFHNTESGPQSEELVAQIQANHPDLEIDLNSGGPEIYHYIAIFE